MEIPRREDLLEKTQSSFEGTVVDLGEDLLEAARQPKTPPPKPDTYSEIEVKDSADAVHSAEILMQEGLIDDAKKLMRGVLREDPHHVPAKKLLQQIQDQEIKLLLRATDHDSKKKRKPEESLSLHAMLTNLERNLGVSFQEGQADKILFESEVQLGSKDRLDIGIALSEMGQLDSAIDQFRKVAQTYTDDRNLYVAANVLLISALIEMGSGYEAILTIEPLLADVDLVAEQKIHFLYLLGLACESLGSPSEASGWYAEAARIDKSYRDLRQKLK